MSEVAERPGAGGRWRATMSEAQPISPGRRLAAWSVHAFTATGAVIALLALLAVEARRFEEALLWLLLALVVDGIDGTLARAARTAELAGRIDGDALDLVIDYLTYVFVPALFIRQAGLLPPALELPLLALVLVSALYTFGRRDMKTPDGYFRGFPALWNVVAFYLFAARPGPEAAAATVLFLSILTFAPVHVVHPFRVRGFGPWLPALALLWLLPTLGLLVPGIDAGLRSVLVWGSAAAAALLVLIGLWRTARGPAARP